MSLRPLSKELQKRAEADINEKPHRIPADIQALRDWLQKQPHLDSVQPSDQWLLAFLRGCKFSLERTKEKIDMCYTLRSIVPEFFSDRDPMSNKIQELLKLGVFLPLRKSASADGTRVCINRLGGYDSTKYHLSDVIKISLMITEILMLEDDNFCVSGEEVIVDMQGVGVSVFSQWTPGLAKKAVSCSEKALPVRMRGNYIINTSTGFEAAYSILRMFLSEKHKKRIKVYTHNYKGLYEQVPAAILPKEYGGDDGTVQELIDYWKAKVESYRQYYLEEYLQCSQESRRPGKPKTSSDLFGIEGSFRKLEVD